MDWIIILKLAFVVFLFLVITLVILPSRLKRKQKTFENEVEEYAKFHSPKYDADLAEIKATQERRRKRFLNFGNTPLNPPRLKKATNLKSK